MNEIRTAFCSTAALAADLLAQEEVGQHWTEQSVLAEFSVAGLSGHLLRASETVVLYLDKDEPTGDAMTGAGYFHALSLSSDVNDLSNQAIRQRGEEMGKVGAVAVAQQAVEILTQLRTRLEAEPEQRKMSVIGDMVITLDEYLRTRLIELIVHIDDLSLSVGLSAQNSVTPAAYGFAIDTLVGTARRRSGDLAVLRAMTRRERDELDALQVL